MTTLRSKEHKKFAVSHSAAGDGAHAHDSGNPNRVHFFACTVAGFISLTVAFLALLGAPTSALAAPPLLWGEEPLVCPGGSGAGECRLPRGIAADRENGHIFVANQTNQRIEEFDALGGFIKAWGWGVDTGAAELEVCAEASTCQGGLIGTGAGQFSDIAMGVAVDSVGNIYIQDRGTLANPSVRVQKFDSEGNFLLMWGHEVNKTKVEEREGQEAAPEPVTVTPEEENLCPSDPSDECKAGTFGSGQGEFGEWEIGDQIAIDDKGTPADADDVLYVGDVNRIQEFDVGGNYLGEFPVAGNVKALDVDSDGNIYTIWGGAIHKYGPGGVLLPTTFTGVSNPSTVAVDSEGHVFAFKGGGGIDPICEFGAPGGNPIECFGDDDFEGSTGIATNLCAESASPGNLYVSNFSFTNAFLRAYGTEPIGCFKARTLPPTNLADTSATLEGTVNPKGETVTQCFFEWGETAAYGEEVPCVPGPGAIGTGLSPVPVDADISGLAKGAIHHYRLIAVVDGETETGADEEFRTLGPPVISEEHTDFVTQTEARLKALVNPEGFDTTCGVEYGSGTGYGQSTPAQAVGDDRTIHTVVFALGDLEPGTEYHWRLSCENESGATEGGNRILFTYLPPAPGGGCSNEAFRFGVAASLPDCRAYEMVSPVEKNGGDMVREVSGSRNPGGLVQAALDGDALTYTTNAAYSQTASFRFNQYLARRTERGQPGEGWLNEGINPPVAGQQAGPVLFGNIRQFMAFTPDLCRAWLVDHQKPPPTADGQEGSFNLYRRENCGSDVGEFDALIPTPAYELPTGTVSSYIGAESVQGHSLDGRHTFFTAAAGFLPEAGANPGVQVYDYLDGAVHLVSVLPGGTPSSGGSSVGGDWRGALERAVSEDGARVYWTAPDNRIYLRLHPEQGIVPGECNDNETIACTVIVSGGNATFLSATPDGSAALYSEAGDLYEFSLERHEAAEVASKLIAADIAGVAGASEDLARVYFVSEETIGGAGVAGEPNLYLAEGGGFSFVATLAAGDTGEKESCCTVIAYNVAGVVAYDRAVRVTPDGSRIVFNSRAGLLGYDNTDTALGQPAVEVYLYDAEADRLLCASCNPSGARPTGSRQLTEPYVPARESRPTGVYAAAWIPTWEQPTHASNVLSADGDRFFFNANDALLPRDANGAQDVYQWEAPGSGTCTATPDNPSYFPQNGGCLYLISSGESPEESEFWEASPDGEDVFFTTSSSLLPQDPGSVDLYDARVNGGFPQPVVPAVCEGEACQSPPAPPDDPIPASALFEGAGNVTEQKPKSCPKGKVRKKGKCVKKKGKKSRRSAKTRRAGHDRRVGR